MLLLTANVVVQIPVALASWTVSSAISDLAPDGTYDVCVVEVEVGWLHAVATAHGVCTRVDSTTGTALVTMTLGIS